MSKNDKRSPGLVTAIALGLPAFGALALIGLEIAGVPDALQSRQVPSTLDSHEATIRRQLESLDYHLNDVSEQSRALMDSTHVRRVAAVTDPEALLADCERRAADLEATLGSGLPTLVQNGYASPDPTDVHFSTIHLRGVVADEDRSPKERVAALEMLSNLKDPSAVDGATIAHVTRILPTISAEHTRRIALRHLAYTDSSSVLPTLLDRLQFDGSRHVREAAAHGLKRYLSDPSVRAALSRSKLSDPSQHVRSRAANSLTGPRVDD